MSKFFKKKTSITPTASSSSGSSNNPFLKTPLTRELVTSWSTSLETLLACQRGREQFLKFCEQEHSEENLDFWEHCEALKRKTDQQDIKRFAQRMFSKFFNEAGKYELGVSQEIRDGIRREMMNPTIHTYDVAQAFIYSLMQLECYPRFIQSQMYKDLKENSM
ncbi:hypothetical protein L5515_009789 [Caenorhabditis briggsae]|uniref:RGS domain-containing protein n=1 Tax=Caenorhabditis briggsae TaxID=6238 RepID=A0AAE9JQH2_CAEBR|nr:hypothetical protein L5515_009789 [Caenorhabditis briggsae]